MNDTVIINTISKIHFILVSILSFILFLFLASFILLQNGLYLEEISFKNVKVKQLYIKWDEKIGISAGEVEIDLDTKNKESDDDYKRTINALKSALAYESWLGKLRIEKIKAGAIHGELAYFEDKKGAFNLSSSDYTLKGYLFPENGVLNINIEGVEALKRGFFAKGNIYIRQKDELEAYGALYTAIENEQALNVYFHADMKKLTYNIEASKDITNAKKIVELFDIDHDIRYWFYDTILEMSSLTLKSFKGWVEYDKLDKAFLNLYADARANGLVYRYDENLSPVSSVYTELEFKDGILHIRPKEAHSYGFDLQTSRLEIDFSKKEEILTLLLSFNPQCDENIIGVLQRYGIKLPFVQTKGEIKTDLKLGINLRTLDVEAKGDFFANNSTIKYIGLDIDVFNVHVVLNDQNVHVKNMYAKYGDIASSHVDIAFDGKNSDSTLKFKVDKMELAKNGPRLINDEKSPFVITYKLNPQHEYLDMSGSVWDYNTETLKVDAARVLFDIDNLKLKIPPTKIDIKDIATASLSGEIDIGLKKADIKILPISSEFPDSKLKKPYPTIIASYNKDRLSVTSDKPLLLEHKDNELSIGKVDISAVGNKIFMQKTELGYGDMLKASLAAEFDTEVSKRTFELYDLTLRNKAFGDIFVINDKTIFDMSKNTGNTIISSDALGLEFIKSTGGWSLNLGSLESLSHYSDLLKKYYLTNGSLSLQGGKDNLIDFSLDCKYKYKFLAEKDEPIENYAIRGTIDGDTKEAALKINDSVNIDIKNDIMIKAEKIGINIREIADFFEQNQGSSSGENSINLYFDAAESFLFLGNNKRMISDTIKLTYVDKELDIKLKHKDAAASFVLNDDKFHFWGDGFGDEFMNRLFNISKFQGGTLSFYINGSTKEYSGTILVNDTTILDYKILNNVLAFVNTVPSLVTFSIPGYSTKGIKTQKAYLNFNYKDQLYHVKDAYLKSKEIEIMGSGEASVENNSIDVDLNLKTQLGSAVSKIPLVGHILLGKENVSTSLKITGALDDPKVETQIAKDIAVAPFNIIKRTLMYPFEMFKSEEDKK